MFGLYKVCVWGFPFFFVQLRKSLMYSAFVSLRCFFIEMFSIPFFFFQSEYSSMFFCSSLWCCWCRKCTPHCSEDRSREQTLENRDVCFRFWVVCSLLVPVVYYRVFFKKKSTNEDFVTKITLVKISVLHFIILTLNQRVEEEREITVPVLFPGSSVWCGNWYLAVDWYLTVDLGVGLWLLWKRRT